MKSLHHLLSFSLALFFYHSLQGQNYTLAVYQEPYVSLGAGFPITENIWDNPNYVVPILFETNFFGEFITAMECDSPLTGGTLAINVDNNLTSVIRVFGPDIMDRGYYAGSGNSMSAIYFDTTRIDGRRVFVQEWFNVGFANGEVVNDTLVDFINFQLRIYEGTNDIAFHFGPSRIDHPELDYGKTPGPSVGLLKDFNIATGEGAGEVMLLAGNPSNPTVYSHFEDVYLTGSIPENTLFYFWNNVTATEDLPKETPEPYFYPNPTSGELHLKENLSEDIIYPVQIISSSGSLMKTVTSISDLDAHFLPPGLYSIRFESHQHGWLTERILLLGD